MICLRSYDIASCSLTCRCSRWQRMSFSYGPRTLRLRCLSSGFAGITAKRALNRSMNAGRKSLPERNRAAVTLEIALQSLEVSYSDKHTVFRVNKPDA